MDRLERAKARKSKRGRQRENIRIVTLNRWLPLLTKNVHVRESAGVCLSEIVRSRQRERDRERESQNSKVS